MKLVLRTLLLAVITATVSPAVAAAVPAPRCGGVSFARQSSDGAFEITARGTACSTARSVAEASRPARLRSRDAHYTALGFSCSGRVEKLGGHGMQVVAFACVRADSLVSFLRA